MYVKTRRLDITGLGMSSGHDGRKPGCKSLVKDFGANLAGSLRLRHGHYFIVDIISMLFFVNSFIGPNRTQVALAVDVKQCIEF
jgi:hypothetical protein